MPAADKHTPGTPAWVDLMTPDLEKARAFYGALFGWKFVVGPKESGYYTMCQINGRNVAGMGQMQPDSPFPPSWSLYFGVEDVDATVARIKEHGGQVVMDPMDVFGEGRMAFCADPTGVHFGLWQPQRHKGAQLVNEPGAMTWHEANTRDGVRAGAFYAAVFGLEPRKMEDESMQYWMLNKGKDTAAGVMQMGKDFPEDTPPHWLNYFAVEDTDATVKKVTELGGTVFAPPMDTPYGRMAVVADPAGAAFAVIKLSQLASSM